MKRLRDVYYKILYLLNYPQNLLRKNKIHFTNKISTNVFLSKSKIGKYNFIGKNTNISLAKIGNYCSIASCVQIGGMEHPYWYGSTSPLLFNSNLINHKETIIEDDVWIGSNVVIRRGVHIGRGAVVGSASVVLNNIPPYSIAVGIPAKVIKMRFDQNTINQVQKTKFWLLNPNDAKRILEDLDY